MRVLLVDPYRGNVGPRQVTLRLAQALSDLNVQVCLASPRFPMSAATQPSNHFELVRVPGLDTLRRGLGPIGIGRVAFGWLRAIGTLVRIIRRERFDVVHSATPVCWAGGIAARICGVPSVYHLHDTNLTSTPWVGAILGAVLRSTADHIVCVSSAAMRALPGGLRTRRKASVLFNAVDPREFCPDWRARHSVRQEMGVAPSTYIVSSFGALDPRKGQQILVQAAALVRDDLEGEVLFIVVGDESLAGRRTGYKRRLVELSTEHRVSDMLRFIGHRQDVARLMQASDIVVQPSLLEAGALVPLEAMSCGIPVVATDVGGIPEEVINGVTGLLVPPGQPGALAEAVAGLLRDPQRGRNFGRNGRAWVSDRFSLFRQALLLYKIYAGLARPVGPSQPRRSELGTR